jgi:hypothetical protein
MAGLVARWSGQASASTGERRVQLLGSFAAGLLVTLALVGCGQNEPSYREGRTRIAVSAMNGWALQSLSPARFDAALSTMSTEGVRLLRIDATWGLIEPNAPRGGKPTYRFAEFDAEVGALARHHIGWLPILDYSAPWAASRRGDWRSPPANDYPFAAYAAEIAKRYGVAGSFWSEHPSLPYEPVRILEVWNEENSDYFWDTGPSPARYARLYLAARSAIHRVDPNAQVMIGGLTNPQEGINAETYLKAMFQDVPAVHGNVDAVGLHPYASNGAAVVSLVRSFRALLDGLGEHSTPIDVTEFGAQSGDVEQEQERAQMMDVVATELSKSDCNIGLLAPYDWLNPPGAPGGDWGLADLRGIRPAGYSWFAGVKAAVASTPTAAC